MLALVQFALPFDLILPKDAQYQLRTFRDGDLQVTVGLPVPSGKPPSPDTPEHIMLNDQPGFIADAMVLQFRKENFDRDIASEPDPSLSTVSRWANFFLDRLKFVAKAPQVRPVDVAECRWHYQYLNDDGTELLKEEGKLRGRGTTGFSWSYIACDPSLWELLHSLPEDFTAPEWSTLLVDARGALPHVGTAVVLAATSLEVLIAELLSKLAAGSAVPPRLWTWINDRGDWQKEPSVEEQYSILLEVLTGHSLKEDNNLWEGLRNIRSARNSFVHEGHARIGRKPVSKEDAAMLIQKAEEIALRLREWLPENLRWPAFEHSVKLEIGKIIMASPRSRTDPSSSAA
jgi:hypothetical protein